MRETERRNSNYVRKTCLVLFSLAGKQRVQMKAGLPQKEGEEGDLEELCAINAYIHKRDLLIHALACSPSTPVFLQDSYLWGAT